MGLNVLVLLLLRHLRVTPTAQSVHKMLQHRKISSANLADKYDEHGHNATVGHLPATASEEEEKHKHGIGRDDIIPQGTLKMPNANSPFAVL